MKQPEKEEDSFWGESESLDERHGLERAKG
jgi:hypothetical protein